MVSIPGVQRQFSQGQSYRDRMQREQVIGEDRMSQGRRRGQKVRTNCQSWFEAKQSNSVRSLEKSYSISQKSLSQNS